LTDHGKMTADASGRGWRDDPVEEDTLPNRGTGEPQGHDDPNPAGTPPLEQEEKLVSVLRGIGSTMFLTSDRIIVARDGAARRPRSGIQSFPLATVRLIRIERANGPSGRVVVSTATGQEAVSMFFDARAAERAEELVSKGRLLAARRRRGRSGAGRCSSPPEQTENRGGHRDH
jgi:hypothetical protein